MPSTGYEIDRSERCPLVVDALVAASPGKIRVGFDDRGLPGVSQLIRGKQGRVEKVSVQPPNESLGPINRAWHHCFSSKPKVASECLSAALDVRLTIAIPGNTLDRFDAARQDSRMNPVFELADIDDSSLTAFLQAHSDDIAPTAPEESRHALDLSELMKPSVRFWVVRHRGEVGATGALAQREPNYEELPTCGGKELLTLCSTT